MKNRIKTPVRTNTDFGPKTPAKRVPKKLRKSVKIQSAGHIEPQGHPKSSQYLLESPPRHNFHIPVQAAIGGKIIARETIKGFRKDVLTKIHGGGARDRKRKLLDKQKKGKARAKQFGKVEIPQEAFIGVLKINKEK